MKLRTYVMATCLPPVRCETCEEIAAPRDYLCPPCRTDLEVETGVAAFLATLEDTLEAKP